MFSNTLPKVVEPDEDEDLVTEIYELRKQSETHLATWREDAKRWYGMVSGGKDQWNKEDIAVMEEQGKPVVSFNRTQIMVRAVTGSEANNRQEVNFLPRTVQSNGQADLLYHAAKWVRDQCDAEDEESDAFRDAVICGYGWTETTMDYEENPEGNVKIGRRDPNYFHYDPRAIKRNLADATWVQCDDYLTEEKILSRWPDAELSGGESDGAMEGEIHDATRAPLYEKSATQDVDDDCKLVIHHCWSETEVYWLVPQAPMMPPMGMMGMQGLQQPPPMGQPGMPPPMAQGMPGMGMQPPPQPPQYTELSDDEYQLAAERSRTMGMPLTGKRRTRKVYKQAYILGRQILEQGPMLVPADPKEKNCTPGFIYQCITGERDRNNNTFYGVVKALEDPQRFSNKLLSQLLHMINTNAKGGLIIEEGAVDDIRAFEEKWAQTESVVKVNSGGLQKIMPKPVPLYPQAIPDLLNLSISSIRDCGGINLEMLGMADRDQPGVVEKARTEAAMTTVACFFDSLRQYRKRHGRLLAYFIINYISDGRLVRVAGPIAQTYTPLIRQLGTMDYDIIVDDAPTSRDMKSKTFDAIMKLGPVMQQQGVPVPAETLDYAPIPSQLSQSWKQQIEQAKQQPPQKPPNVQAAEVKAQSDQQIAQMRMQGEGQNHQMKAQADQGKAQMDGQIKMALEQMKLQNHAEIEQMKAMLQAQQTAQEQAFDRQMRMIELFIQTNNTAREREMQGTMQ